MSTTRHLINRQRRLAAVTPVRVKPRGEEERPAQDPSAQDPPTKRPSGEEPLPDEPDTDALEADESHADESHADELDADGPDSGGPDAEKAHSPKTSRRNTWLPAVLGVLTVLLGGFAAYAGTQASDLHDDSAAGNSALTDVARTTEVKGQVTSAVDALFSYNYADTGKADRAAATLLTGKAVQQHKTMLAAVRAQAAKQKLVLTTTVTASGVELIDGSRARVLLFADQSNTDTAAKKDRTTYAAAMFAVDAVRGGGSWKISNIDTFTR
ncbi:hypothetical protein [Streptomyces sp. NBC_01766]|uniref:hypothetical protein n=1 Tax=Streptomyces sp. NBC_01766 TaxID=2975936 RepID=UPI002DDAE2D1|nr:hypothetical protein [Streptomyces sp. NBC_01766]WSC18728.1 hypothetical protein OIE60_03145 [Streptomyces sp. NBC_01766]